MEGFGGIIQAVGPILKMGTTLAGLVSQMSLASKEKAAMDRSIYYSKHPEAISAIAQKLQQPLSSGLTAGVGNVVNASMAEQGLSQAPGIQSQVLSQALAPYQQRNQETALTAALQAIGLPTEALKNIRSVAGDTDLTSLLKGILPAQTSQSPQVPPLTDPYNNPDASYGITVPGGDSGSQGGYTGWGGG